MPFVTVFWKGDPNSNDLCKSGGGWDTHGNNFNCLQGPPAARVRSPLRRPARRPASSAACSTRRWCWSPAKWAASRRSAIRVPAAPAAPAAITGPACMSVLLAGGGIRGGQVYGTSDRRAEYPGDNPRRAGTHRPHRFPRHGHRRPARHRPRRPPLPSDGGRPGAHRVVLVCPATCTISWTNFSRVFFMTRIASAFGLALASPPCFPPGRPRTTFPRQPSSFSKKTFGPCCSRIAGNVTATPSPKAGCG